MTAYQLSQPWLSKINEKGENASSLEWVHLRKYLQGIDDGSISLFNLNALNATIGNLTISSSTSITGNVTIVGNLIFSPTTNGIKGTTTNDNAASGNVGEYVSSFITSATNFQSTATWGDLTSISLTAGDWGVMGTVLATLNSATMAAFYSGISTTSGNVAPAAGQYQASGAPSAAAPSSSTSFTRISVASTTTVYLKYYSDYSAGTPQAIGSISARRMR